jgi:predicted PurR-regulated permease PerM
MESRRAFELVVLVLAALLAFLLLSPYLPEILGAILVAYLLRVPHRRLAPYVGNGPAALGLLLVTIVLLVVPFALLVTIAVQGLAGLAQQFLGEETDLQVSSIEDLFREVMGPGFDVEATVQQFVREGRGMELVQPVLETIGGISEAFVRLTVLLFLSYYLLTMGEDLVSWIASTLPLAESDRRELFDRTDDLMYAVIVGNFLIALADGVLVGIGLWVAGLSNVIFLTVIAVFLAFIPLIGSMVIWIPAAAFLIATGDVVPGVLLLAYGAVVVGSVDNVLRPFVGASEAGLDPATFIVGIFGGLSLVGVMGVFYGPIFLAMSKEVYDVLGPDAIRGDVGPGSDGTDVEGTDGDGTDADRPDGDETDDGASPDRPGPAV